MKGALHLSFFLLLQLLSASIYGQYSETFPTANKGILSGPCSGSDGTTCLSYDFAGVNWTIEGNLSGIDSEPFATNASGQLVVSDVDEEACWVSPVLNITGASASFSLDLSWVGYDPSTDYIDVEYTTNGGTSWTQLANAVGGPAGHTVYYNSEPSPGAGNSGSLTNFGASGITGPTLQIRVCIDHNAATEVTTLSNISATNANVGGTPPTCDLAITGIITTHEDCPGANDGSLNISATTSNGPVSYSITGPVNQSNSTGVFTGLPDGTYSILVRDDAFTPGSCDQTASRTINAGVDNTVPYASNPPTINVTCISEIPAADPAVVTDESDNCTIPCTTEPWINEFHYDNNSTDVNEFIEIAGPAGLDLSAYTIYTYDGSDRMVDQTFALSGTIDDEENGFGALTFATPNLQNQMEGIALVKNTGSEVIEFISYEGSFIAVDGPAFGLTSMDVGVSEPASQTVGESLARIGSGNEGSEFTFADQTATAGSKNGNQTFLACPENLPVVTLYSENSSGIGNQASPRVVTRVYQVADAAGNVSYVTQTITATDSEAPSITCPSNIVLVAATGLCSAVVTFSTPSASDNCGASVSLISALGSGSAFPVGVNTVTFEAEDAVANTKQCSFTVTVNDQEDPLIVCPADIEVSTDAGICGAVVTYAPPAGVDNCPGQTTMRTGGLGPGATFPVGVTTETYTVTDASGNIDDCSFNVTVKDTEDPLAVCQDITVDLQAGSVYNLTAAEIDAGSADNCVANLSIPPTSFGCADVGLTIGVQLTVTDNYGNVDDCTANVTVGDANSYCNQAPTAVCQNITVDVDGSCTAVITPAQIDNGSSDPDGDPLTLSLDNEGPFSPGTYTVELTVSDGSLEDKCTATVTVEDNIAPEITCPSNIVATNNPDICGAVLTYTPPVGTDNCSGASTAQIGGLGSGATFPVGVTTEAYRVTDAAGNTKECSFTVTVNDTQDPVLICSGNIVQTNDPGTCGAVVNFDPPSAVDNCPGAVITRLSGINTGSVFPVGVTLQKYQVVDASGNTDECEFTVTVTDDQDPVLICSGNIVQTNDPGTCGAVVNFDPPSAVDNCPGAVITRLSGINTGSLFPVGVTLQKYQVVDASGNTDECEFTITVTDDEDPIALCKTTTVQLGNDGTATILPTDINNGSSDNCSQITLEVSPDQFDCTDVGPQIVTLTVTDLAGNTDDCSVEITVVGIVSIDEIVVTDESCDGAGDGTIAITASGTGTLEYSIDGGATFQDNPVFVALDDDTYDIVVRDKDYQDCTATATAIIAAGPVCHLSASDPCSCLNNASPYDMDNNTGGGDGQFAEVVTISADSPLPAGLIFRVIAPTTGVYDVNNIPAEGVQSAGVPVATDGSVTFAYNSGVYELAFVHNDGDGYNMTVILEVEGVNAIGFQLSNTCFYPEPVIESDLAGPFCSLSLPFELVGSAGGVDGTGTFYIDGTEITTFDPALYAPGTYTISYVFDAGAALGYTLENNIVVGPPNGALTLAEAEEDPGCIATVIKSVEVIPTPEGYACRDVNVNLQENCQAELIPENVVGDLDCVDLSGYFAIQVEDGIPENGPIVDGCGTYKYTVTGPEGHNCWGYVTAEDKTPPTLDYCPEPIRGIQKEYGYQPFVCDDISILYFAGQVTYTSDKDGNINYDDIPDEVKAILDITGYAIFKDNCGDLTITVSDEIRYGYDPDCDEVTIRRTFTATDACKGLLSPDVCYQDIIISKPALEDVFCPEDVELNCDDDIKLDANGNPHPDETGYPWLYTAFDLTDDDIENYKAYLDQSFCNLGASYTDGARIEVCPGTYKVVRTWEILDWCTKEVYECQQIIKVGDNEKPVVTCDEIDYDNDGTADLRTYSTGPYDCTAAFEVPMPEVTDNCSDWEILTEIVANATNGPVIAVVEWGSNRYVAGIPLGCHFLRYTVTDLCGNKTITYCPFVVEDQIAPIAVCNDDLNVSIGGQGLARVYAADLDEGSSDNCGPIRIEVRRRVLAGADYECLDQFDYDQDGEVIDDEVSLDTQAGSNQEYYYTPWLDYVDFTCCDIGEDVRVELRVWDDRNGDGQPGNTIDKYFCNDYAPVQEITDNSNVCWMDLTIEDKLPAYCVPPLPATIDCDELPFDFDPTDSEQMTELFGTATGTDNCPGYTVTELAPNTEGLDDCGYGAIVRRFEVTDARGLTSTNTCQQVVTVKERHHYKIKFPKDAAANCGIPQADTIEVEELSCDLLAISVKDDFFSASGDECYKIFRTYSVINWCEYDGISDPVVVSRDEDCDGKPGDEDVWVIVETVDDDDPCADYYGNQPAPYYSHVWYDRDGNPFNLNPKAGEKGQNCDYETNPFGFWKEVVPITENETDDTDNYPDGYYGDHCEDMASVGYWQYTQIIKVYDNVNPVVSFTALDPFCSYSNDVDGGCPADVTINFTIDENCTPEDLSITLYLDAYQDGVIDEDITSLLSGVYPNYSLTGSFPLGAHYIGVSVKDGCGNQVGVNIPFEVVDCKAPSPICINGLAVELMPLIPPADADGDGDIDYGAIDIWASDFIASPNSDCSGDVTYSINRIGEDADPDQTGLTLTCDDDASQLIEVWAWDEEGNGDFCETYVLVQDNMINCETASNVGSISGTIANEKSKPIDGVDVELSGNSIQSMETPADGHYIFSDLGRNYDYTVTPFLDAAPLNGVSTFDLVLMSKHILDVQPLSSPYQIIAADVNRSKTITTLDAIQLRRLILNIDTRFTNNTSWRFIPRDFKFQDSKDPWLTSFPEVINVNNLQGDLTDQDFVAIKVGDLNFNALTNALEAQPRTMAGRFLMDVPEQEMKRGEVYRIDFTSSELEQVQGYQFTLLLDPESILLEDLDYGVAEAGNFGLRFVEEGLISTSWNKSGTGKEHFTGDDRLFTLVLRAQKDVRLSEVLRISNRLTIAEAYDVDDQLLEVGINYGTEQVTTAGFELYQNVPNPFRQETSISFYLPTDEQVSIRIYDAGGRTVKMIRGGYGAGYHQLKIDRDELGAAGLMYYTLTAGEYTATRKMVIME